MHPMVMGIRVNSNEEPRFFPKGRLLRNSENTLTTLKKILPITTGPISTKFGTKHPLVMGIQGCSNEEPFNSHKVNYVFSRLD